MLRELLEISAYQPEYVRCQDDNEAKNERALERLLILAMTAGSWQSCGIAKHRQPQNNGFRSERLYLSTDLR
jgi:hypothetical protein